MHDCENVDSTIVIRFMKLMKSPKTDFADWQVVLNERQFIIVGTFSKLAFKPPDLA